MEPRREPSLLVGWALRIFCTVTFFILLMPTVQALEYAVAQAVEQSVEEPLIPMLTSRDEKHSARKEEGAPGITRYETLFATLGRNILGKRQGAGQELESLKNNVKISAALSSGKTRQFRFPADEIARPHTSLKPALPESPGQEITESENRRHLELKARASDSKQIFVTLSICRQPSPSHEQRTPPPPLELYISSSGKCTPGSDSDDITQTKLTTEQGFVKHSDTRSSDVCIAVRAPETSGYTGSYEFEVAASIDHFFSDYHDYKSLYVLDSDTEAGLFISTNLTKSTQHDQRPLDGWLDSDAPFRVFIHNQNDTSISGLQKSFCGLNNTALVGASIGSTRDKNAQFSMTTLGNNSGTMTANQQFYVPGLNASSSYYAIMSLPSNYSQSETDAPTAGGSVWKAIEFDTKTYKNCQLIYGLSFCSTVAYAVPSSGDITMQKLRQTYDDFASSHWQNFSYSLQQVPCDTEPEAQYSLATNCANCSIAYKQWLCAVTIPRCADFTSQSSWLQPRNVGKPFPAGISPPSSANDTDQRSKIQFNSSRNDMVDRVIKPGPYKEMMPCGGLCYGLVQACPASLGFACPGKDIRGMFDNSYRDHGPNTSDPQCNFPGSVWGVSAGMRAMPSSQLTFVSILVTLISIYSQFGG